MACTPRHCNFGEEKQTSTPRGRPFCFFLEFADKPFWSRSFVLVCEVCYAEKALLLRTHTRPAIEFVSGGSASDPGGCPSSECGTVPPVIMP